MNDLKREKFDLAVIGTGPAGIHAAVQGAKLQKKVCLIEKYKDKVGGAWIHWGTLPSKTIRESLAAIQAVGPHVGNSWLERLRQGLSTSRLFERAKKVAQQEQDLVMKHLKSNNIEIIRGQATIESKNLIRVLGSEGASRLLAADNLLIATGSRPRRPHDIPFDGWRVVDSDEILQIEQYPKNLIIYGAGVVGCEYACIFAALGIKTTLVDARSRIMQTMDREIASALERSMESLGVEIKLNSRISDVIPKGPSVELKVGEEICTADLVFFAAGRVSNSEHLGLDKVGIEVNDRGAIIVNDHFQTACPNIYAAGDVIGPPALAATSAQQGRHAICHAFEIDQIDFPEVFPVGIYTIPELSSVGLSEEECQSKGLEYVVGRATYSEIARGHIRGDHHGMVKLIVCKKTHRILGLHIFGDDACNLVHIGLAHMVNNRPAQDLLNMIFNYPTLAEAYRIATFNALNKIFTSGSIGPAPEENHEDAA